MFAYRKSNRSIITIIILSILNGLINLNRVLIYVICIVFKLYDESFHVFRKDGVFVVKFVLSYVLSLF